MAVSATFSPSAEAFRGNGPASKAGGGIMLDVILDLVGGALFLGQAVYFLLFTASWTVSDPAETERTSSA
jgi:hypothetical protein